MTKREPDPIKIQLTLGILGFLGVLLTVLATIFGPIIQENLRQRNQPTATPIIIVETSTPALVIPTDTVPPGDPTSTPAPATDTPVPTFTATSVPILAAGEDWRANCISTVWMLYPAAETSAENNCLRSPVDKFFIADGKLSFALSVNVPSAEQHGLFTKLPADGSLTVNMHLNEVSNGEILVGVFAEPNFNSSGALMVIPASNNPDRSSKILLKSMPGQSLFSQSSGPVDSNSGTYDLLFDFNSGEVSLRVKSGQINLGTMPVLSSDKWLFIGYQVFIGSNRLSAEFSNLIIIE